MMVKIITRVALLLLLLSFLLFGCTTLNKNTIGLKVLSWVKTLKGDAVNLKNMEQTETAIITHEAWTALVQQYVSPSGTVDYLGFIEDKAELEAYLATLSNNPPGTNWTEADKMAYWINAYNAFTVKLIIDHYPLTSIKDISNGLPMIGSSWDIKFFQIGHIDFDLNTIEHEILRKQFAEPRIHFAINCASFSCPKLRDEAFEADRLEQQLEDQARAFINNPDKNRIAVSETKLSSIFSWFEGDFVKKESLASFIGKYHADFNEKNKIDYITYDWSLNE